MAGRQTIVENGRVSALFKTISSVAGVLIAAGILGIFASLNRLDDKINALTLSLAEKNTQDAVQNINYENAVNDHARFDRRITELERQRDSERDNR